MWGGMPVQARQRDRTTFTSASRSCSSTVRLRSLLPVPLDRDTWAGWNQPTHPTMELMGRLRLENRKRPRRRMAKQTQVGGFGVRQSTMEEERRSPTEHSSSYLRLDHEVYCA